MRKATWILQQQDVMVALREERMATKRELKQKKNLLLDHFHEMMHPKQETESQLGKVSLWLNRGMATYEGIKIGMSLFKIVSAFLRKRRRHR